MTRTIVCNVPSLPDVDPLAWRLPEVHVGICTSLFDTSLPSASPLNDTTWVTICPRVTGTTHVEVIVESQRDARKIQILRLREVCKTTGLGRSMVYQLEADRRFPARVRIGTRAVGWVEEEIQGWLAERILRSRRPSA